MKRLAQRVLLALGAAWAVGGVPSGSAAQTLPAGGVLQAGPLPRVQVAAGQQVRFDVPLHVAAGFHVQANPASNEFLIPLEFALTGGPAGLVEDWTATYPSPERMRLEGTTDDLLTYHDDIAVAVQLRVAADAPAGRHRLQAEVHYQACNARRCLFPTTLVLDIPVDVTDTVAGALMRVRLPELERRYGGDADGLDQALSIAGRLPDVEPDRVMLRIEATGRPGFVRCEGQEETPVFAHLHAAGRLYGREFSSGCLSDSVITVDIPVVPGERRTSDREDELVLWWTEREVALPPDCRFAGGDFDVLVQRVEIVVQSRPGSRR